MKTDIVIIKYKHSKYFFGYISGFPAICAQSDTENGLRDSLINCANHYFNFTAKTEN